MKTHSEDFAAMLAESTRMEEAQIADSVAGFAATVAELMGDTINTNEITVGPIELSLTERKAGKAYRRAKVGHADRVTKNGRIYPRAEWAAQVDLANRELIPNGRLTGAVDHSGSLEGGNLKNSPIVWKSLEIAPDGAVHGEFEIIASHKEGANLLAQIEAGMAIGFSTDGSGQGREPTQAERAQFGIADAERAVVIFDWRLEKIDAVDDPAIADAWLKK